MVDLALKLDRELRESVRIALAAGKLIQSLREEGVSATEKADRSIVTRADIEADALICRELDRAFPGDGLLSEEEGYQPGQTNRCWIIDPLDGTQGFVDGSHDYAVQIALVEDGQPVIGVVHEPATGRLYQALRTVGTFLSFAIGGTMRQLKVRRGGALDQTRLITSSRLSQSVRQELATTVGIQDGGTAHSVGFKMGKVVRRESEAYFSVHPVSLWDICAPQVVLEAAGGRVTLLDGSAPIYDPASENRTLPGPFLATNSDHHERLCEGISAQLPL